MQAFSEMIFVFGDVHCDPHAANLLVRRAAAGGPELVLLDHGLYRCAARAKRIVLRSLTITLYELDARSLRVGLEPWCCPAWRIVRCGSCGAFDSAQGLTERRALCTELRPVACRRIDDAFRHDYAALWHALIFADRAGIQQHAARMNAGGQYSLFASMLTQKPWETIVQQDGDRLYRRSEEVTPPPPLLLLAPAFKRPSSGSREKRRACAACFVRACLLWRSARWRALHQR